MGAGIVKRKCWLRSVEVSDADLILEWVNDPMDRANSFSSDPITRDDHIVWLESALKNPAMRLYIMMLNDRSVGHIKLKIDGESAEIGYCIAPEWRGMGLAKVIVALAVEEAKAQLPEVKTLIAQVKPSNIASSKALGACGYQQTMLQYEFDLDTFDDMNSELTAIVDSAEGKAFESNTH
ncbi:GNAT family N-acetyltransferase [Eggerthella sp. HF-4214]|uniref:GNAT family N-acetyltransferase n=1 Tax=Eggerthella guodeyinii TaxID=2690837 RepID=A0A6N7RRP1_9ACTN|nr:GNAT family N-acetyltransferase [Eggerthella guodeyinii]